MQPLLVLSLFLFSVAFGSPADVLYIEKLVADEAQLLDAKDFDGLANIFTKNAIYNPGAGPNINGIDNIQAALSAILPPEVITQDAINTESITLLPPFNEQGAAGTASGVVYTTVSNIGQGDLTGQVYAIFAKYEDKYVKTGESARYGGWKISQRFFVPIVSCPKADCLETQRGEGDLVTVYPSWW